VREAWASIREFGRKIIRRWYFVAVGVVGGILGIVNAVAAAATKPGTTPFSVPLWVWLSMLAGGFLVAIIWAFHDVRIERDAAKAEMTRRFDALRYALKFSDPIDCHTHLAGDGTIGDVEISFTLTNNSEEYLRYELEEATAVIQGQQSAEDDPAFVTSGILEPHGSRKYLCSPVRSIPIVWDTGSLKLAARYGHPSAPLRYRKSQERRLKMLRPIGRPPERGIQIRAALVSDPDVEDVV
jgi:hypothetical protein